MINVKRVKGLAGEKTPVMLRVPHGQLEQFREQINGPLAVGVLCEGCSPCRRLTTTIDGR